MGCGAGRETHSLTGRAPIGTMLAELCIQNFAIIDTLEISFHPGLNVLSGETGAGKSIIVGALSLLLGDRASAEMIRLRGRGRRGGGLPASRKTGLANRLRDGAGPAEDLVIRRSVSPAERTHPRQRHPVSLSMLSMLGECSWNLQPARAQVLLNRSATGSSGSLCRPGGGTGGLRNPVRQYQAVLAGLREIAEGRRQRLERWNGSFLDREIRGRERPRGRGDLKNERRFSETSGNCRNAGRGP